MIDLTCRTATSLIPEYLDDELEVEQSARLEQHLIVCPGCLATVQRTRAGVLALAALRPAIRREAVWDRVVAGLQASDATAGRTAYKFLRADRMSPFANVRWPAPGEGWLTAVAPSSRQHGHPVHACRAADLAYWIDDALWVVELDGHVRDRETGLTADRARLVAPVAGWPAVAREFTADCLARLDTLAELSGNAEVRVYAREMHAEPVITPADAGYVLAHAVDAAGWDDESRSQARASGIISRYVLERRRQGLWLSARLDGQR